MIALLRLSKLKIRWSLGNLRAIFVHALAACVKSSACNSEEDSNEANSSPEERSTTRRHLQREEKLWNRMRLRHVK
jgi:hypothetical protein